jgi:hypothetical protein
MCVFVYHADRDTNKSVFEREPLEFREAYIFSVKVSDFRKNPRGELGTRTATLHKAGITKLRGNWIYKKP